MAMGGYAPIVLGLGLGAGLLMALGRKASAAPAAPPKKTGSSGGPPRPPSSSEQAKARALLPLVTKWANTFGAPPSLVMAIAANESGFNPNATNLTGKDLERGGAWGLTQLTMKTVKGLHDRNPKTAKKYWPTWDGTGKGLLDPNVNLAIAAFGIAQNWKRYKAKANNWLVAGTAWNVGAGAMDKQMAKGEAGMQWVLRHPYALHIAEKQRTNPVITELFAMEKQTGKYAYA